MWVRPVVLEDEYLRLEPLSQDHARALRAIAEQEFFRYFITLQPDSLEPEPWRAFLASQMTLANAQSWVAVLSDGRAAGSSSYLEIRAEHRALEIGFTWIAREFQGTWVNPAMKRLMLSHAFEDLGCLRVQLKTDARNLHSQGAIRKLGAQLEGTLRKHAIQADGFVRDTVMFSILAEEWPDVKKGLDLRLARFPA